MTVSGTSFIRPQQGGQVKILHLLVQLRKRLRVTR